METFKKLSFPKLENEYLDPILTQLVRQHHVIQMFFTKQSCSVLAHLIIHTETNSDVQLLQQNKWVTKVRKRYHIDVFFIYTRKLHRQFVSGHPFTALYCQSSAIIYQNIAGGEALLITSPWKKYKKRFNTFEALYYHDHDLQKSNVESLVAEGISNSVFTSYARLFEYDLGYLEELYSGTISDLLPLDDRITKLADCVPEIQKYFVKKSHSRYFLTDLFTKAKDATANDDAIYNNELYEAVGITEQGLYSLIEQRFNELKKLIKKSKVKTDLAVSLISDKPGDDILNNAVAILSRAVQVEQIYFYHQITYAEKATYYLMLIGEGVGNEKLKSLTQSLKSRLGAAYDFVILCHSRAWIQCNLYQHQSFFSKILQSKFLMYSSSDYCPKLHWEVPHNPYHADLYFSYTLAKQSSLQFFGIYNNTKGNYTGMASLFALFFMSFCRTYIFVKTYYLPNHLSSQALWGLCVYADGGIRKYSYLLEQFWTEFFPFVDRNMNLHQRLVKLRKEDVDQMNIIVEKLMGELHELVIEGDLMKDVE